MTINLSAITIKAISDIPNIYKSNDIMLKYHNSNHIHDLINKFCNSEFVLSIDPYYYDYFIMAIIYHDSVYDIKNMNNNEMNSYMKFAESIYSLLIAEECRLNFNKKLDFIRDVILSTKYGCLHNTIYTKIMHDLDYSGFAEKNKINYLQNALNIYDEFYSVIKDNNAILPKRIQFLEEINESKIFYFDVFDEELAHENITFEIDLLKKVYDK